MDLYEWKDTYSVGIKSIDQDHQGMLNLINQLFEAMSHGKAKEVLSETLSKLIAYTRTHFKREEILFSTTNYPDYQEHKTQHDLFIDKINDLKKQFDSGATQISVELIKYLTDWLVNHILISDKKYMNHLKKYGVS